MFSTHRVQLRKKNGRRSRSLVNIPLASRVIQCPDCVCNLASCRSLTVTPGDPTVITPPADLKITNVALGDEIADENSRTTIKLTYRTPGAGAGDEDQDEGVDEEDDDDAGKPEEVSTAVLCSLTYGRVRVYLFYLQQTFKCTFP